MGGKGTKGDQIKPGNSDYKRIKINWILAKWFFLTNKKACHYFSSHLKRHQQNWIVNKLFSTDCMENKIFQESDFTWYCSRPGA